MNTKLAIALVSTLVSMHASATADDEWRDASPHKEGIVTVNGEQIAYLDWGGSGRVMLFLNGWSDTAHSFDDLAPRFTNHFRCVAFTRRGYGQSSQPKTGYDPITCAEEVLGFLDAMKIDRANLVGHSFGGTLMTILAAKHPDRVGRLVFLDGIYDFSLPEYKAAQKVEEAVPYPSPNSRDLSNMDAYRRFTQLGYFGGKPGRPFWSHALEASMRQKVCAASNGVLALTTAPQDNERFTKEAFGQPIALAPYYRVIQSPALAICSDQSYWDIMSPEIWPHNKTRIDVRPWRKFARACWRQFRQTVPKGTVVVLKNANHDAFNERPSAVAKLMHSFLIRP